MRPMSTSRRAFLATTASAIVAAPAIVSGRNLNSKLNYAGIGTARKGFSDIIEMTNHKQVQEVAFCDVDLNLTKQVRQKHPQAKIFQDYVDMFESMGNRIDAVTVSTPDHTHAIISLAAMARGKHVYCQKPLTRTVWEARQMRLAAKKSGVITRMGNQIHSHTVYRSAVRFFQSGALGKAREVHSWIATTGAGRSGIYQRPTQSTPVPEGFDWNLWVSGAPMRPYAGPDIYHPRNWRDWQDFGGGALGDFGCHIFDPVYTALKITGDPIYVRSENVGMNDEVWPEKETVEYVVPGTKYTTGKRLKITWYDGGRVPSEKITKLALGQKFPKRGGSVIVCEGGNLFLPHVAAPFTNQPDIKIPKVPGLNHYHGWVDGCISGRQPSDGFEYGGHLTECVQLGNVAAHFPKQTLKFDAKKLQVKNNPAATKLLTREYRDGFEVKPVG